MQLILKQNTAAKTIENILGEVSLQFSLYTKKSIIFDFFVLNCFFFVCRFVLFWFLLSKAMIWKDKIVYISQDKIGKICKEKIDLGRSRGQ